ncbi:MAG: GNAT family N-acetyltransferase [Lachnospiraceae bacterium]|nr:GNAT family N-acetyltransferase [Lachnospiraceae bacterium]
MYPVLETESVILRPFDVNDDKIVFELVKKFDEQTENQQFSNIQTLEDAKRLNEKTMKGGKEWLIIHKQTNTPLGWVLCEAALGSKSIRNKTYINAWIRAEFQHIGLGHEILEKILNFAFYGIKTNYVLANAKNCEKAAYDLLSDYGFEIYNFVPKKHPNDSNTLVQFRIAAEDYFKLDHSPQVYDYELPKKESSPYSYKNPIRKIDSIKYIKQPTGYLCGQSVIAMLANVSVDEVIAVMNNDKETSTPMMREALKYYGIRTATKARRKYIEGDLLPDCCILSIQLPEYGHWSLYFKKKYYDPEFGVLEKLPERAKLCAYWEIVC